jgi:hypothetical protein
MRSGSPHRVARREPEQARILGKQLVSVQFLEEKRLGKQLVSVQFLEAKIELTPISSSRMKGILADVNLSASVLHPARNS